MMNQMINENKRIWFIYVNFGARFKMSNDIYLKTKPSIFRCSVRQQSLIKGF